MKKCANIPNNLTLMALLMVIKDSLRMTNLVEFHLPKETLLRNKWTFRSESQGYANPFRHSLLGIFNGLKYWIVGLYAECGMGASNLEV